jgi:hypothetical protein
MAEVLNNQSSIINSKWPIASPGSVGRSPVAKAAGGKSEQDKEPLETAAPGHGGG